MKYLHIIAEGKSELEFIRKTLTPHLAQFNVFVYCQMVHTGGNKVHPVKGGLGKIPKYRPVIRALERWKKDDEKRTDVIYSTMLDLYAFPKDKESPYTKNIRSIKNKYDRIEKLELAMKEKHGIKNFIPYVQLHEFETFILADLNQLVVMYPHKKNKISRLKKSIEGKNVELINDGISTAPSKRIIQAVPEHEGLKSDAGPIIAEDIGIEGLKTKCAHFKYWVECLEKLDEK